MKKYTFALLSVLLVAAGCQREVTLGNEGETITFSASTSYEQDNLETKGPGVDFFAPETKTAFSGRDENDALFNADSKKERIDWQVGDKIFVNMVSDGTSKTAVYTVGGYQTSSGADKTVSETTSLTTGTPITATGIGQREFLATYPADNSIITSQISNGIFAFKMPEGNLGYTLDKSGNNDEHVVVSDNMDYAVMVARASSSDSNVQLHFKPYFNAYQFILGNAPLNYTLTKVTLSCTSGYLRTKDAATVQGSIKDNGDQNSAILGSPSDYSQSITYDFSQAPGYTQLGGITLQRETGTIDITLLALPVAQSGISITFYLKQLESSDEPTPFTYTLPADKTLQPFHKLRINGIGGNKPDEWEYKLDVVGAAAFPAHSQTAQTTNYTVNYSYRQKKDDPSYKEPVKWATYINIGGREEGTQQWVHIKDYTPQSSQLKAGWIKFANKADEAGMVTGSKQRVVNADATSAQQYSAFVDWQNNPDAAFKDALSLAIHPGVVATGVSNLNNNGNAIDLSMYNLQGSSIAQTTANCYVVSAPGWYKIPLVYGNMLKNGGTNSSAAQQGVHVRHDGQSIGGPWIKTELGGGGSYDAELVWQDNDPTAVCADCGRAHGVIDIGTKNSPGLYTEGNYLYFHVPQHSIKPGNNVIGVKKNGELVWSWHIWITDQALGTVDSRYLNAFIGWIPLSLQGGTALTSIYPARSEQIKIVQVQEDGSEIPGEQGQSAEIIIIQPGNMSQALLNNREYKYGRGVYFQYGRKDPMFPALSTGGNNGTQPVFDGNGNRLHNKGDMGAQMPHDNGNGKNVGHSIKNPALFYTVGTPFTAHVGGYWNSSRKTVYDPSPIGYRVIDNFNGSFKTSYQQGSQNYVVVYGGVTYPGAYIGSNGRLFTPAIGQRSGQDSVLVGTPADRTSFGGEVSNAFVNLWSSNGAVLRYNVGLVGSSGRGKLEAPLGSSGYDLWNLPGIATDGYPVLCIGE